MSVQASPSFQETREVAFRRYGRRNILAILVPLVGIVFGLLRMRSTAIEDGGEWNLASGMQTAGLMTAVILVAMVPALLLWNAFHRRRAESLGATTAVALTLLPWGQMWRRLTEAFPYPEGTPVGRVWALRLVLAFTLTADDAGLTLWKGLPSAPVRLGTIEWRDVIRIEPARIASGMYLQNGLVLTVGDAARPTELAMVHWDTRRMFKSSADRAQTTAAFLALEVQRQRALDRIRRGEG